MTTALIKTPVSRVRLPDRWTPLKFHAPQRKLWGSSARFISVVAGRGSGKTEIAKRKLVRWLPVKKPWSVPKYFYAGPTLHQTKRIAWQDFKDLIPPNHIAEIRETDNVIKTIFGSELHLLGFDKPHRSEGVQWDGGVIDENSDIKPKTFALSIRPALSHKKGWCMRIGVPKRFGVGAKEFQEICDHPSWESYHWKSSDILPPEEIEQAKRDLSLKDYLEQYEASWVQSGGLAFYSFDKQRNVSRCTYDRNRRVVVGVDFNVNPMAWVMMHVDTDSRSGETHIDVFDEIFIHNSNTREALDVLHSRYPKHKGGWTFIGDATCRARKTSATKAAFSDYLIIKHDERFNAVLKIPKQNPSILDRLASTNLMLNSASRDTHVHIDPNCKNLIDDLLYRPIDDRGMPSESAGDMGHITDAIGYVIHMFAPLHKAESGSNEITIFRG